MRLKWPRFREDIFQSQVSRPSMQRIQDWVRYSLCLEGMSHSWGTQTFARYGGHVWGGGPGESLPGEVWTGPWETGKVLTDEQEWKKVTSKAQNKKAQDSSGASWVIWGTKDSKVELVLWWEVRLERLKGNQTVRSLKFQSLEIDPNCRGATQSQGRRRRQCECVYRIQVRL